MKGKVTSRIIVAISIVALSLLGAAPLSVQASQCDGLLKALENMPPDKPGYQKVLEKAQSHCGYELDHAALLALYESTDGDSWRNQWTNLDSDHCDGWWGVGCDTTGRVNSIDLYFNGLSGSIPAELGYLSGLQELSLSFNQLSGSIPAELGDLSRLRDLVLWNCNLSGSIPPELGKLSSLEGLDLSFNELSGSIPPELGNLSSLQYLSLTANQLSGAIPAELGNLSSLLGLQIYYNRLSGPIPSALANLSNLRVLLIHLNPDLGCWETQAARDWATGLQLYLGPDCVVE